MIYPLNKLTKNFIEEYFKEHRRMDIKANRAQYHIIKAKNEYYCYSWYCWIRRKLTKEMKKVFK